MEIIKNTEKKKISRENNEYIKYTVTFTNKVYDFRIDTNKKVVRKNRIGYQGEYFRGRLKIKNSTDLLLNLKLSCKPINKNSQINAQIKIESRGKIVFNQFLEPIHTIDGLNFIVENIQLGKKNVGVHSTLLKSARFKRDVLYRGARINVHSSVLVKKLSPKKDPGRQIEIYYATNRNITGEEDVNLYFGDDLDTELHYGKCFINIPAGHKQGKLERPFKVLWWSFNENKDKHIILSKIEEQSEVDFYSWIKSNIDKTEQKSGLLFVHGYNNSFSEAAWRTGQITYDTPFCEVSGFFSWPSSAKKISYLEDETKAISSIPLLEKFIEDFIIKTGIERLHIIAHSMGNLVVTQALNNLSRNESFKNHINTIQQIILAAPDIDQDIFNTTILPSLISIGKNRTLYASDKDKALKISELIRVGRPRIGQGGEDIYIAEGIDTVDASNVMSEGNHHSYIFETKELLNDMNILFNGGWEPAKRGLREVKKNDLTYWLFKE